MPAYFSRSNFYRFSKVVFLSSAFFFLIPHLFVHSKSIKSAKYSHNQVPIKSSKKKQKINYEKSNRTNNEKNNKNLEDKNTVFLTPFNDPEIEKKLAPNITTERTPEQQIDDFLVGRDGTLHGVDHIEKEKSERKP